MKIRRVFFKKYFHGNKTTEGLKVDINTWVKNMKDNKNDILNRLKNTSNKDIIRIRNEAAENGVEMTISEVKDHLNFIKNVILD